MRVCVSLSHRMTLAVALAAIATPSVALAQSEPTEIPAVVTVLPEDIGGVLLTNTTDAAWTALNQFQLFQWISESGMGTPGPMGLTFLPPALSYEATVKPWIGDRAATVLMPAPAGEMAIANESMLTLAPIADPDAFEPFLEQLRATRAEAPTQELYNGVTILSWAATEMIWDDSLPEAAPEEWLDPKEPEPEEELPDAPNSLPGEDPEDFAYRLKEKKEGQALETPLPDAEARPPLPEPGLAIAVLPNGFVALAESPAPIQQFIDGQGGPTLADNAAFRRTLADPNFERSLWVAYGNLEEISKFDSLGLAPPMVPPVPVPTPLPVPPVPSSPDALLSALEPLSVAANAIEVFIYPQAEGLRSQGRLHFRQPQLAFAQFSGVDAIYDRLPAPTYFLSSGSNLALQWRAIAMVLEADPSTAQLLDTARTYFLLATGLDLDEEFIGWMDGEYTLFFFPSEENIFDQFWPQFDVGIGLMVQTRDRPAAEAALSQIDALVAAFNVAVTPRQVNEQPITSWDLATPSDAPLASVLTHGWLGDDTLVLTTGLEPMARLNPAPLDPLSASYTFKTATDSLPSPNQGYVYFNAGSTLALIYQLLPPEWTTDPMFKEVQRFLGTVRSFSATTSSTERYLQVDFLLGFAPTRE